MKVWSRLELLLQEKQLRYHVEFSRNSLHAAELVRELVKENKVKALVVVGGDGTIQSIIRELAGSDLPLGLIPAGSGNDFASALRIPLHTKKALDYLLTGTTKKIDIARTGSKYCITVVGIGIDGKVAQTVNDSRYKKWFNLLRLGQLSYVLSFFLVLLQYRPTRVNIKIDGTEQIFSNVWLIAAANFPNYGGGMMICPGASYADGVFDICIVHGISRLQLIRIFPKVYRGQHIFHRAVTMLQGQKVEVISDSPMLAHGDGEIIGETPIEVSVHKEAIYVIYNERPPK